MVKYYKDYNDYKHIGFRKSTRKGKKYDGILEHKKTKLKKYIPFGAVGYQQYKDSTGLKLYTDMDHLDDTRRKSYRARHAANGYEKVKYSPAYFSFNYLW